MLSRDGINHRAKFDIFMIFHDNTDDIITQFK